MVLSKTSQELTGNYQYKEGEDSVGPPVSLEKPEEEEKTNSVHCCKEKYIGKDNAHKIKAPKREYLCK